MKKVLYIDDEADTEQMASKFELMQQQGIDCIPVSSVRDVLPLLDSMKDSIDLIVLDLIMPPADVYSLDETDGGALTGLRLLKDIRRFINNIPVIVVSVRRRPFPEEITSEYEISRYLEKPISAFSIANAINEVLAN